MIRYLTIAEMIRKQAKKPVERCPTCYGLVIYRIGGQPCAWCGVVLPEKDRTTQGG